MKKIFFITAIAVLVLMLPQLTYAQMGMMGGYNNASGSSVAEQQQNLDNETNAVLKSQNVNAINQLDCSKVSQDQLEKVGDAWMGVMAGNETNHSAMEQRMGGEGSQAVKQSHIQMGENYLGCANSQQNNWMPMMNGYQNARGGGFPMMGYGYGGMMNGGLGWGFGIGAFLFWIIAFIDLILLGIFLWKKIRK